MSRGHLGSSVVAALGVPESMDDMCLFASCASLTCVLFVLQRLVVTHDGMAGVLMLAMLRQKYI